MIWRTSAWKAKNGVIAFQSPRHPGLIDWLERCADRLAFLSRGKLHRITDQVHDAGLRHCFREHGGDGFGKPLQAVDHGDQDLVGATRESHSLPAARIWRPRFARSTGPALSCHHSGQSEGR